MINPGPFSASRDLCVMNPAPGPFSASRDLCVMNPAPFSASHGLFMMNPGTLSVGHGLCGEPRSIFSLAHCGESMAIISQSLLVW